MNSHRARRASALLSLPAALLAPAAFACPPVTPGVVVKCVPTWTLLTPAPYEGLVAEKAAPLGTLQLSGKVAPARDDIRPLLPGDSASGSLAADDGSNGPLYRLATTVGQRYTLTLASADFDAFLSVGTLGDESEAATFHALQIDDDSGGGTDAQLTVTAPESGRLYARVAALTDGEAGAFTLAFAETTPAARRAIVPGETVQGTLDAEDATLADGSFVDLFTLDAAAGERFEITLASDDFDAYVSVGRGLGEAYAEIDHNDDGDAPDDGTHARLSFTATESGTYVIGANSLAEGETGRYRLRVERR